MFSRDYANAQQVRMVKTFWQAETAAEALILPSPPSPKTAGRRRELSCATIPRGPLKGELSRVPQLPPSPLV